MLNDILKLLIANSQHACKEQQRFYRYPRYYPAIPETSGTAREARDARASIRVQTRTHFKTIFFLDVHHHHPSVFSIAFHALHSHRSHCTHTQSHLTRNGPAYDLTCARSRLSLSKERRIRTWKGGCWKRHEAVRHSCIGPKC